MFYWGLSPQALLTLICGVAVTASMVLAYSPYDRRAPIFCIASIVYMVYAYYKTVVENDQQLGGAARCT